MKQNTPIQIRVVANGYIIGERAAADYLCGQEHVFTDAASLGAFVAQFYAQNHPQPDAREHVASETATKPSEQDHWSHHVSIGGIPVCDEVHNPDNLTPEQVGVADGWRLLRKSELTAHRKATPDIQLWRHLDGWDGDEAWVGSFEAYTYRTRIPFGQIDAK